MSDIDLDQLYRSFTTYAWRLEARDVYGIPEDNDRLQAFLRGIELPPAAGMDDWASMTAHAAQSGRPFARVRMVGHPVTDYTRWELSVYPENIAAGEDVRVLDRDWLDDGNPLWDQDFWLFDDKTAVIQNYDEYGSYLGPELAADPTPYVALRARAIELSVPYADYIRVPGQRRDDVPASSAPEVSSLG